MYQQALLTTVNYIQPTYISIGRKVSSVNYGILTGFELVFEIRCNFDILEFDAKLLILAIWLVGVAKFRVFWEIAFLFLPKVHGRPHPSTIIVGLRFQCHWWWDIVVGADLVHLVPSHDNSISLKISNCLVNESLPHSLFSKFLCLQGRVPSTLVGYTHAHIDTISPWKFRLTNFHFIVTYGWKSLHRPQYQFWLQFRAGAR